MVPGSPSSKDTESTAGATHQAGTGVAGGAGVNCQFPVSSTAITGSGASASGLAGAAGATHQAGWIGIMGFWSFGF